jgi:hypothetical protein
MSSPVLPAAAGDVCAVWTGSGFAANMIRVAAALEGKPGVANHVVILTHQDPMGRWIGIEGRPGGVGLVDCDRYLIDPRTRSNHHQPRDPAALPGFLASCVKSLGLRYDWAGIARDGLDAIHCEDISRLIDPLWRWGDPKGPLPGGVVCSSLAALRYRSAGWAGPALGPSGDRAVTPADWYDWSDRRLWEKPR